MGYRADTPSACEWEGLNDEQRRLLKIAYLMGAKDALQMCEGNLGGGIVTGELTDDLIGAMDHRLGFFQTRHRTKVRGFSAMQVPKALGSKKQPI